MTTPSSSSSSSSSSPSSHQHITTVLHSEEAATLSIAMICLLEFTKELAAKSSNGITIDQTEIDHMVKRHLLAAKSSEGQGMSYEQESNVIGEAVKLLEGMFSQLVVKPAEPKIS
jgi:hypothetical protein